ncbi:MAG: hypothetical protein GXO63_03475 [Candidatus Micrarchaeota archaeon]|nr:hypothetical protein [Candidatus Micrarchaeota archaeon]
MKATTSLERILILLIGVFVLLIVLTPLLSWLGKQRIPDEPEGCAEDTCLYSPDGRICIENPEPECVCRVDDDCPDGRICARDLGAEYGKCK